MKLADSHSDVITSLKEDELDNYFQHLKDIQLITTAVFTTNKNYTFEDVCKYKNLIEYFSNKYNIKLLFSIEDIGFLPYTSLDKLVKLKPYSVTLSWNSANQYCGGAHTDIGLTSTGIEAIKKLENHNILIDTAHMSRRSFYDFIDITKKPIFCSHANIDALYSHPRNLTDDQIKKIVDSRGYLGLTIYPTFISNEGVSSIDIANQFDYLIKKFGSYNFGFGTDLFGIDTLPTDIKNYFDLYLVANRLINLGHTHEVVERIMHQNFLDFYNRSIQ